MRRAEGGSGPTHRDLTRELARIRELARSGTGELARSRPGRVRGDSAAPTAPLHGSRTPQVTVAMPARDTAPFIAEAIASVLDQREVDLELIVVDDGSRDETRAFVRRLMDPRLTLLHNPEPRGISSCHNRVLERSRAPYIAHVDSDDVLLPGALRRMVSALEEAPEAGQACCDFFTIDRSGRIDPEDFGRQQDLFRWRRDRWPEYRRSLLVHGMVANHLRTYRREVFERVGRFREDLEPGVEDYDMAVRVAEVAEIVLVPEFLYCRRVHGANTSERGALRHIRFWWSRVRICQRRLRERGSLLGRGPVATWRLLLLGLPYATGIPYRLSRRLPAASERQAVEDGRAE